MILDPSIHIGFVIAMLVIVMVAFAWERYSLEVVAMATISFLLVFYQLFPVLDPFGRNLLDAQTLLAGFANPSLVAVVALLIIGQGLVQTNALNPAVRVLERTSSKAPMIGMVVAYLIVLTISGMLNNTPLVIIFIPIIQALAVQARRPLASVMMPLSYVAILGGMTTVVGSSTNLLVSSSLTDLGYEGLGFFSFIVPGSILAGIGFIYVLIALPRLLPNRGSLSTEFAGSGKQFIAELDIGDDSALIGGKATGGRLEKLPDITLRQVHRGYIVIGPPFDNYEVRAGDILIVAATRTALAELLSSSASDVLIPDAVARVSNSSSSETDSNEDTITAEEKAERVKELGPERFVAEVMIAPASRLADRTIDQLSWSERFGGLVLGIQRRARMVRGRLSDMRLQPGDVLLIMGNREMLKALEPDPDLLVLARSLRDMPIPGRARHAMAVFLVSVSMAATGILPIAVAALMGVTGMIIFGCLNIRQAVRSIDRKIVLLVAASLALGAAMQHTGAAEFLAKSFFVLSGEPGPAMTASLLFLIVAIATNLLSNNACAVLFTPIAVSLAEGFGLDPLTFAITVVLAANCSFASPIGYQTNLLVMGPGNYRFIDYMRGGAPLVFILWIAYSLMTPMLFPSVTP
ncbi:MAG: SLC13 family permease [Pseudomonadota bacterium]